MKYIPLVNIKQGTKSIHRYSNGNTLPLVQLPFAMCGFSAQTKYEGGWYYYPDHRFLEGVRLTHQPSPWINDYGTFLSLLRLTEFMIISTTTGQATDPKRLLCDLTI